MQIYPINSWYCNCFHNPTVPQNTLSFENITLHLPGQKRCTSWFPNTVHIVRRFRWFDHISQYQEKTGLHGTKWVSESNKYIPMKKLQRWKSKEKEEQEELPQKIDWSAANGNSRVWLLGERQYTCFLHRTILLLHIYGGKIMWIFRRKNDQLVLKWILF